MKKIKNLKYKKKTKKKKKKVKNNVSKNRICRYGR